MPLIKGQNSHHRLLLTHQEQRASDYRFWSGGCRVPPQSKGLFSNWKSIMNSYFSINCLYFITCHKKYLKCKLNCENNEKTSDESDELDMQILESTYNGMNQLKSVTKHLLLHLLVISFSSSDYNFFCETEIISENILHFVEQM